VVDHSKLHDIRLRPEMLPRIYDLIGANPIPAVKLSVPVEPVEHLQGIWDDLLVALVTKIFFSLTFPSGSSTH